MRQIFELRGYILALVPYPHMADDIVQETFLTASQRADTFEPGTNFKAWVFAIARYKVLDAVRRRKRQPELLDPEIIELLSEEVPDLSLQHDQVALLNDCVSRLARTQQRAICLRYQEGCAPPEIASRMSWSLNAVNVLLARARKLLRQCVRTRLENHPA